MKERCFVPYGMENNNSRRGKLTFSVCVSTYDFLSLFSTWVEEMRCEVIRIDCHEIVGSGAEGAGTNPVWGKTKGADESELVSLLHRSGC